MRSFAILVPHVEQVCRIHARVDGSERSLVFLIAVATACIIALILETETRAPAGKP
jgi:hypothetical protein